MSSVLEQLVRRFHRKGIVVDTNMLLVYLVGLCHRPSVAQVLPSRAYSTRDFDLLSGILQRFSRIIVTPAVLSQVSDLAGNRLDGVRLAALRQLMATRLPGSSFSERLVPLNVVTDAGSFVPFGFADATIETIASEGFPVFTDDAALYDYLARRGAKVFNYNHVRMFALEG
jgi:rRNA-processing protein FCF1